MEVFTLRYLDFALPAGGRDATRGHILEVDASGQTKRMRVAMSGTAFHVLKPRVDEPMTLLLVDTVVYIEKVLQDGMSGFAKLSDISLHSSEVGRLELLERTEKSCSWQSGRTNLTCAAARDARVRPTTLAACAKCVVPDQRWVCSHFVHPQIIDAGDLDDPHARMFLDAQCNSGAGTAGKTCFPGSQPCWERRMDVEDVPLKPATAYVVDMSRPFSNLLAIRQLVRNARGCLRWYERDLPTRVLEIIAGEIGSSRLTSVRLLSGDLERFRGNEAAPGKVRKDLRRLKSELEEVGIPIEWRELKTDSVPHDRVLVSDAGAFNVPPLNTLLKGDTSEILPSAFTCEWFDGLWERAEPLS
jgi:hypothetical protein